MKIVRIIARLNVGGPARHVVWLTRALQGAEFQSVLLAGRVPPGEEDMAYFAAENGVEPVFIDQMSRELSLQDVISLWKVYRHLLRERPDIIHTHTAKAGFIGRAAGFIYRWFTPKTLIGHPRPVRFVHTYHGHVFHSYYGHFKTKVFLTIEKLLARFATNRIVVISQLQFNEIHHQFGVGRASQFAIVPLGIDLERFQNSGRKSSFLRTEIGAADDELLVGLVGRLTEIKNIPLFLEVAKTYCQQAGLPKLRFVIIGDGHLRQMLEDRADEAGIRDNVDFFGNRNDIEVCYAGLDIVALTSLNEGTPLSLIEAMACGKPVISTGVGGVPDLLGDVETQDDGFSVCRRGLIVESLQPADFSRGLVHLALDKDLRIALGTSGREYVAENYAKERLISDIINLYRELAGNRQVLHA